MANFFSREIIPLPQPDIEVLETQQTAYDFYAEVRYRQALDDYCQWYYAIAAQNRRDLENMRREVNIMGLFRRTKSKLSNRDAR